jgi:hypothetical protein
MSIVEFKKRKEQSSEVEGPVRCRGCGCKWIGGSDAGVINFECPACGTFKGVRDSLITPEERYVCPCGSDVFSFSRKNVYCANCGGYHEPWNF